MFKIFYQNLQILLKENMKAEIDKSWFFITRFKILGHINEGNTRLQIFRGNTTLQVKLRIDAILKFDSPSKKKIQVFFGMLDF